MVWFLLSSTWLMIIALLVPSRASWLRRRALELAVVSIVFLPWLSHCLPELDVQIDPTLNAVTTAASPVLPVLWAVGALIGFAIGLRQYRQVIHLKRQARQLESCEIDCIQQMLRIDTQTVRAQILVNGQIETPMALPSSPGSVLLPEGWLKWSPTLQKAVLKHEWHHVQQHDAWLGCLMRAFLIVFWFNPVAWYLISAWVAACEHEADLAAVSDEGPVSYADDLLAFARAQSLPASAKFHEVAVPAFTRSRLACRIELLLAKDRPRLLERWIGGISIMALILSLIGCAWLGRPVAFSDKMQEEAVTRLSASAFPADAG